MNETTKRDGAWANGIRIGMLTPSSNTVLEPLTYSMITDLPGVSAHFSRFRVTEISLSEHATAQFGLDRMLNAAELLADADVDVIAWNGTSGGWLGFDHDARLCVEIEQRFGIPATTSTLAMKKVLVTREARTIALVSPYRGDLQARIIDNYETAGFTVVSDQHLNLSVNQEFSRVDTQEIVRMVETAVAERPDAIMTYCTNFPAAPLAAALESDLGCTLLDSISVVLSDALLAAGGDPTAVRGWGKVFSEAPVTGESLET